MTESWTLPFGAQPEAGGTRFRVWAPGHERVDVVFYGGEKGDRSQETGVRRQESGGRRQGTGEGRQETGEGRGVSLEEEGGGYFSGFVKGVGAGGRYKYRLDGGDTFPDPASRCQPDGVHGPSEIVDPARFRWTDAEWRGIPLEELVIYEIHVGTFTAAGTFDAVVGRLAELRDLGVTAVQLMPVADFPGERNWGYDGVDLYAPARAYGGPEALKRLIDAAHAHELAVLLDVVYNHFGPEGNYLPAITSGKIFSAPAESEAKNDAHHTPWGAAVNYDGEGSGAVREFVIQNAFYWIHEYHFDGLRLDATHSIIDDSSPHLLQELVVRVGASVAPDRHVVLIAEDERNERRLVTPVEEGGVGLDAVWADDFHHQLRRLAAGDEEGYFANYSGTAEDLAETLHKGWYYEGQVYPGHKAPRGTPAADLPPPRFVHTLQNHDQIGNRALGERLNHDVDVSVFRAASALLCLGPYTPLLFMGQEWAASTPFLYFTDHPEELGRLVTEGRREEFKHFSTFADPDRRERIPDPQAEETFLRSRLRWEERELEPHSGVYTLYRELLALRRSHPMLRVRDRQSFDVAALGDSAIALRRGEHNGELILLVCSFRGRLAVDFAAVEATRAPRGREWTVLLTTEDQRFGGAGRNAHLQAGALLEMQGAGAVVLACPLRPGTAHQ
ncbi:MAG: malto-oligosyltrehalose trehalohydrolase [Gemmatimonadetes bacterium]|nr:malto-oligosyltrehalose trehalohydrolase [Gemmatimonadota bacterium]